MKNSKDFQKQVTYLKAFGGFSKTYEEMRLFRVIFEISSLVIDYRSVVIDYTVNYWGVMSFQFEFQNISLLVIDYTKVVIDYNI